MPFENPLFSYLLYMVHKIFFHPKCSFFFLFAQSEVLISLITDTFSSSGHYSSHEEESFSGSLAPRYHPVTSPSPSQYDQLAVSRDVRDNRLSPTYDSRSRNISGEGHYRETVEKSLQTSHNLMSVVTGSITPSQPKTRPTSQASKQGSKKNQPSKEVSVLGK